MESAPPTTSSSAPPLQAPLTADEIRLLSAEGRLRSAGEGDVIFRRGEKGSDVFLVERGEVALSFADVKGVKRVGPGTLFGELALLHGEHERTATAVATTPSRLRVLTPDALGELSERSPPLVARLLRRSCLYLLESEQALIEDLRRRNRELERTIDGLRRARRERDLQELLAQTDELTGLSNRRGLNLQIADHLDPSPPPDASLAVLLLDVDRFKGINDHYGHALGDLVLCRLAAALRRSVRASDLPCRIGGDEFAVLLPRLGEAEAVERASRLMAELSGLTVEAADASIAVSVSMGGALLQPGDDREELLARADRQLYLAKRSGRGRLAWGSRLVPFPSSPSRPTGDTDDPR